MKMLPKVQKKPINFFNKRNNSVELTHQLKPKVVSVMKNHRKKNHPKTDGLVSHYALHSISPPPIISKGSPRSLTQSRIHTNRDLSHVDESVSLSQPQSISIFKKRSRSRSPQKRYPSPKRAPHKGNQEAI